MLNTGNGKSFCQGLLEGKFRKYVEFDKKQLRRGKKKGKSFAVKLN